MGIPAGLFMKRFGYKNGVLFGLALFATGSFFVRSCRCGSFFRFFGIALFILGCGISTLETVAHPFVASLGDQRTSDMRINFAQAFNALGTIIGPAVGSYFLLRNNVEGSTDLTSVKTLYIVIGSVIATIAVLFSFVKVPALIDPHVAAVDPEAANVDTHPEKGLFQHRHFKWAVLSPVFQCGCAKWYVGIFY